MTSQIIPNVGDHEWMQKSVEAYIHDAFSPKHYSRHKTQPIDSITERYGPGFILGNIEKYISRYDAKNGVEDVKKAKRYCEFLINFLEGRKPSVDATTDQ